MKTLARMFAVVMTVMMTGLIFTACGSVKNEILGDWTTSMINGRTCEDNAADSGVPANQVALNLKLESDKATVTGVKGSQVYSASYGSDGVELKQNGNNAGFLTYNKSAGTLTMNDSSTGSIIVYVFVKGTTELPVEPVETTEVTDPTDVTDGTDATDDTTSPDDNGVTQSAESLTGRDYGELDEDELDGDNGVTQSTESLTGSDYGELDDDELNGNDGDNV